jgi:cytochrome b561
METRHEYTLVVGHADFVLKHHFIDRDRMLASMLLTK